MKRSPAFIDYSAAMETAYMTAKEIYEPEERSKKKIRLCHEAEYGDEKESNDIQENKLQTMKTLGAVCEGDLLLAQLYAQLSKKRISSVPKTVRFFSMENSSRSCRKRSSLNFMEIHGPATKHESKK